ncbi:hypothetical protein ANCCAN_29619, partial [Ancylostoma caninum]
HHLGQGPSTSKPITVDDCICPPAAPPQRPLKLEIVPSNMVMKYQSGGDKMLVGTQLRSMNQESVAWGCCQLPLIRLHQVLTMCCLTVTGKLSKRKGKMPPKRKTREFMLKSTNDT